MHIGSKHISRFTGSLAIATFKNDSSCNQATVAMVRQKLSKKQPERKLNTLEGNDALGEYNYVFFCNFNSYNDKMACNKE